MKKLFLQFIATTVIIGFIACSKSTPAPPAVDNSIKGGNFLAVGTTLQLSNAVSGGTWASSDTTVATITSSGVLSGVKSGIVFISYSVPNNFTAYDTVSVTPSTNVVPITGGTSVSVGSTLQLSNATFGGVWGSSDTTIAKISSSGLVTGVDAGSVTITYIVNNAYANFTAAEVLSVH